MRIRCGCLISHPEHGFTPGAFNLCQHCGHGVGAHQADAQPNAELAERLDRLLRLMDVGDCRIRPGAGGAIEIDLVLVPNPRPRRST